MKYARFSKELGACHCSSFEKQKRGVGGRGGKAAGGRKEVAHRGHAEQIIARLKQILAQEMEIILR